MLDYSNYSVLIRDYSSYCLVIVNRLKKKLRLSSYDYYVEKKFEFVDLCNKKVVVYFLVEFSGQV